MGKSVYISYRRGDVDREVSLLANQLQERLGADKVLVDQDFVLVEEWSRSLERALASCAVMLVVIGGRWLSSTDMRGQRRADDPGDWVRLEIGRALALDLRVVPVLVGGASMPSRRDLPEDIGGLVERQATVWRTENWPEDTHRLLSALRPALEPSPSARGDIVAKMRAWARGPAPVPAPLVAPPPARAAPATAAAAQRAASAGHSVFISYAFEDESWAQKVVQRLEAEGHACWIASRDVVPGAASYAREITLAIKASRLMVVLVSKASNLSDDVLNEITLAKNNRVPRLPVRIDDNPLSEGLEYFFSQAQRLEPAAPALLLDRLLAAVRHRLA